MSKVKVWRYDTAMRKLIAATLAGVLSLGVVSPALAREAQARAKVRSRFEQEFQDWKQGFWGNEALARMITKGVIKGDSGNVAAVRPVSRLEAAIMLTRLLDLKAPEIPLGEFEVKAPWGEIKIKNEAGEFEIKIKTPEGEFEFEDDRDVPAWGRDAILSALQNGFLLFDGARMSPRAPLHRLEAAIMLVKAGGLDAEAKTRAGAELSFTDASRISEQLRGYIAIAVEKGFVTGYEDGSFQPQKLVTRAEWAALLDRLDRNGSPVVSRDGHQVKGAVTAVTVGDAPSITMTTPVFPSGVTYPVDDSAVFYEKGKAITLADVAAGDNVIINLGAEREVLMVTVHNVPVHTTGTVKAYTAPTGTAAGSLTVTVEGADKVFPVTAGTAVTLGDTASTANEIRVGDRLKVTTEGAQVTRIVIKGEQVTVTGALSAVTPGQNNALPGISIAGENNITATFTVADHATLAEKGGTAITLTDLKAGDRLVLTVERNMVIKVVRTQAAAPAPATITGSIVAVTAPAAEGGAYTLGILVNNTLEVYTVAPGTTLSWGNAAIAAADLKAGDQVQFTHDNFVLTTVTVTSRAQ